MKCPECNGSLLGQCSSSPISLKQVTQAFVCLILQTNKEEEHASLYSYSTEYKVKISSAYEPSSISTAVCTDLQFLCLGQKH